MLLLDVDTNGTAIIRGSVLDPSRKPIIGAEVWIDGNPRLSVITDMNGRFIFNNLPHRELLLKARYQRYTGERRARANSKDLVLELEEGQYIRTYVIDQLGMPIVNAIVVEHNHGVSAVTNADGVAQVGPLRPGQALLEASAPGRATARHVVLVGNNGVARISLQSSSSIHGLVTDDSGHPVHHARVFVYEIKKGLEFETKQVVSTGDAGEFRIDRLASDGVYRLLVVPVERYSPLYSELITPKYVSSELRLRVVPGCKLDGIVTNSYGQRHEATVYVDSFQHGMLSGIRRQVKSGIDGVFKFEGIPCGDARVVAESQFGKSKVHGVQLSKSQAEPYSLVVGGPGVIAGQVVAQKPWLAMGVVVQAIETDTGRLASSDVTGSNGDFRLENLPLGRYLISVQRNINGNDSSMAVVETGDLSVRLDLLEPGALEGLVAHDGERPELFFVRFDNGIFFSGQNGVFSISNIAPGRHSIHIYGGSFVPQDVLVVISPGKLTRIGPIDLEPAPILQGEVLDKDGHPVAGATIVSGTSGHLYADESDSQMGWVRFSTSGEDGKFSIAIEPSSGTLLSASHPTAGRSVPYEIQGLQRVTLTLKESGQVRGRIHSEGESVKGAFVSIPPEVGFSGTDESGAFVMNNVPSGTHDIYVELESWNKRRRMATVVVESGREVNVDYKIPDGSASLRIAVPVNIGAAVVFLLSTVDKPHNAEELRNHLKYRGYEGVRSFDDGITEVEFSNLTNGHYVACLVREGFEDEIKCEPVIIDDASEGDTHYCVIGR